MLEEMSIQNFQVHKKLSIQFSPTVTTIVGGSDVGKTSIIRALFWLAFNKPTGNAFIRDGERHVEVNLQVDGKEITRAKGRENLYSLDDTNFVAFGNDVPDEIFKLLNLSPKVNFQMQHDSPFWLSNTSGEVSRQLNQIVNLGIIDSTLANLARYLRTERTKVDVLQQRTDKAKEEKKALHHVRKMDEDLKRIESLQSIYLKNSQNRRTIESICILIVEHQKVVDLASQGYSVGRRAVEAGQSWVNVLINKESLQNLIEEAIHLEEIVKREIPDINHLEKLKLGVENIQQEINELSQLIQQIEFMGETECRKRKEMETEGARFRKSLGKECPLCGQKIK